jgi:hypothetical protein
MHGTMDMFLSAGHALRFFFLDVLPVASQQMYYWVRDWQILLLGLFALFLAWRWSVTVERRAERIAKEILNRTLRLRGDADNSSLINGPASYAQVSSKKEVNPAEPSRHTGGIDVLKLDLLSFRTSLRNILAVTPVSDEYVPAKLETAYRKLTSFSFSSFQFLPGLKTAHTALLAQLDEEIGKLALINPLTCRQLWQHLVDLNAMARALEEAILPDVSS